MPLPTPAITTPFPANEFADALRATAQLAAASLAPPVVHITINASDGDQHNAFDTHWNQLKFHGGALERLAGGLAFDDSGSLWYTDQLAGLYKCVGTVSCALVTTGFFNALLINFDKGDKRLYVADGSGNLDYIDPSSPAKLNTFVKLPLSDAPVGVAAGPHP